MVVSVSPQVLEGQLEVLKVEVEQLGDQVDQAIQKWKLDELRRPYSRLSNLSQQLQHQAALRWKERKDSSFTFLPESPQRRKEIGVNVPSGGLFTLLCCSARGQRLREVLQLHEFRRESSELRDWMEQQRQIAESQEMGNNYQHVQVRPPLIPTK